MRYDYDAIVVGARVAGSSTAMLLARHGHSVLLLDRATMPSDTVSTHAIMRTGILQLTRWGVLDRIVAAGTPPICRLMLGFGPERIPFALKAEFGIRELYAPRRFILDNALMEAAINDGVDVAQKTSVFDLLRDTAGTVYGVEIGSGRNRTTVTARMVIGADGVRSRVAERVGAPTIAHHGPTNCIHYAYYTGVETPGFWFQFTPGVNAGMIPTDDGAVCVFAGHSAYERRPWKADPDGEFRRLLEQAGSDLAERVASGSRISGFRGTPGLPGFLRRPWGSGWALVGDAGYSKDPISAHGMSDALRDAELTARAIDQALRRPGETEVAMAEYQRVRDALSLPIYRQSEALAKFGWDAEEASQRMRVISDTIRTECRALLELPEWSSAGHAVSA